MDVKMRSLVVCGMLLVFSFGCDPVSVSPIVIPTLPPTSTSAFIPTTTPLATPTALSVTTQPLKFYFPKVEKHCPDNREVPVDKLGIGTDTRIILSDLNQTGLWSLDSISPSPQLIQELPLDKWGSKSISPDGKMLAYTIWNPDNSSSTRLYDLETGVQRELLNIKYWDGLAPSIQWLSDQELLVVNLSYQRFPLYVINISTLDMADVSDIDSEPYDEYLALYSDGEKYFTLYSVGNVGDDYTDFYVYDYSSRQKIQALPWLQNRIYFFPYIGTNLGMEFGMSKIFMTVEQSYGFDVGVVTPSIESLTQSNPYDVVTKRVFANTGNHFDRLRYSLIGLDPANGSLFLNMSYRDYIDETNNIADFKVSDIEGAFFSFDYQNVVTDQIDYLVFTDYCFTMTDEYFIDVSPDGLIAVFGSDRNIVLLNLETGNMSRLSNWSYIGWAQ